MIAFVRWISRAYRPWPNKLAQSSPEWMWRGCFVLVAIVAGGVAASGAGANSFGGLAERTYREAIYQPTRESIDVGVIDPLPYLVAIRAHGRSMWSRCGASSSCWRAALRAWTT